MRSGKLRARVCRQALAEALTVNSVLAELQLTGCDIGADGAKARPACLRQSNSPVRRILFCLADFACLFGGSRIFGGKEGGRRRVPSVLAVVGS